MIEKLDEICTTCIVLRRLPKTTRKESSLITYYKCHRGGKKRERKRSKVSTYTTMGVRQSRTSILCQCEFIMKVISPVLAYRRMLHHLILKDLHIFVSTTSIAAIFSARRMINISCLSTPLLLKEVWRIWRRWFLLHMSLLHPWKTKNALKQAWAHWRELLIEFHLSLRKLSNWPTIGN